MPKKKRTDDGWESFLARLSKAPAPEKWRVLFFYSDEQRTLTHPITLDERTDSFRITRCLVLEPDGTQHLAETVCSDKDNFSKRVGRQVAYRRVISTMDPNCRNDVRLALPPGCKL